MPDLSSELRTLWMAVLERQDVADDSDFFDLGGTSIAAVTLAAMVQEELGIALDALDVVLNPTFREQLLVLADSDRETPA